MHVRQSHRQVSYRCSRPALLAYLVAIAAFALVLGACDVPSLPGVAASTPTVSVAVDVPVPPNTSFHQTGKTTVVGAQVSTYTVANTDPQHIEAFYKTALPNQGWIDYHSVFASTNSGPSVTITAQKVGRALIIVCLPRSVTGEGTIVIRGVDLQVTVRPLGV